MKNSRLTLTIMAALTLMASPSAMATVSTWTGGTGAQEWSAAGNWSGGIIPGSTGTLTSIDTATFSSATPGTSVTIDPNRNIGSITFTTSAGSYTIGSAGVNAGNSLLLTNGGVTSIASGFTGSGITETFNAPLVLEGASTSTAGSYSFTNNAPSANNDTLNFAGNISGGTTSTVTLNLNGTNAAAINTISGAISNGSASAFSLAVGGNSTWLLNANNSGMTGGTVTVNGGSTLLIGNNNALGTDNVNLSGASSLNANFGAVGNVTVSNNFTETSGTANDVSQFVGSGNLTITGTYINSIISNPGLFNFSTGTLNFGGSFYLNTSASNGAIFQMKGPGNTTFSGSVYNSTSTGTNSVFSNLGSGTITISGSYNANGKFFDYGGTLVLDTSSIGTRLPNNILTLAGVTVDLSGGSSTSNQTVSSTAFNFGQTTIQDTNSGTALINLGAISTGAGGLVNFGSGAATTSKTNTSGILGASYTFGGTDWAVGNTATTAISGYNLYTAFSAVTGSTTNYSLTGSSAIGTSISQNTLKINSSGAGQSLALSGGVTYTTSGLLYVGANAYSITGGTLNALAAGSTLIVQQWGAGALTISSVIADNAASTSLTKGGTGTLILGGANTYTGATYITDGTVSISSDANLGGQNTVAVVSSSTSSTTVLLAATAPTNMVEGSSFLGSTILSVSGTAVTLSGNANQTISSSTATGYIAALALNGGTLSANSTFSMVETLASQQVNRAIVLGANGGTLDVTTGNVLTVAGVIGNAINQDFFPGVLWTPLGALTKTGAGTLVLGGANTYSGGTTISGGILEFVTPTSMPTTGAVNVNSGSTLAIAVGGAGQFGTGTSGVGTIGGIFSGVGGQGASTVNLKAGSAVGIDTTGGSVTYGGNITNAGVGLTKLGSNALTLTGSNTYTGGTIISSGTLVVSNTTGSATGTGALQLNSGATLTGTGTIAATNATINGKIIVGNGGTTDILHMSATGTTSFTNASLTFNLDTVTQGNSSELALGSTPSVVFGNTSLTLNLVGSNPILTSTGYTLFTSTATTDVYSGLTLSGSIITSGLSLTMTGPNAANYGGTYLELVSNGLGGDNIVAVVPEPGTWALMLGGLLLLTVCQRARRARDS